MSPKALQQTARKVTGAEKLTTTLEELNSLCSNASKRLAKGKSITKDLTQFAGIRADLNRIDKMIGAEFAKTRGVLARVKSKAKNKIQARVERDYARKMRTTKRLVGALAAEKASAGIAQSAKPKSGSSTGNAPAKSAPPLSAKAKARIKTKLTRLTRFIEWVTPEEPHQPLGTELPHRIVDYNAGPPTLGTNIAPAYAPNTPNAQPSPLPRTPTAADTSETIEVRFTDDISATANQLQKNPVKMYEFVRNTMNFEPYYGSRKGANETLLEKGGNDFDQASLLIALFRYCGIPARYVQGVVDVPIAKAMNWVGVEKPEVALKLFSSAGIPVTGMTKGGRIAALRIEHVWTEVYLDYQNYRGTPTGSSSGKKRWIPLDPSFKQYEAPTTVDLPAELLTLDMNAYLAQAPSPNPVEELTSKVATYLAQHSIETTLGVLTQDRQIAAKRYGLLPARLTLNTVSVRGECFDVPGIAREKATFRIDGAANGGLSLSETIAIPEIAGKSIALTFEPATQEDDYLAMSYLSPYLTPAYLLAMKPVIHVDGQVRFEGRPLECGKTYSFTRIYHSPSGNVTLANAVTAGSDYGICIAVGRIPLGAVEKKARELDMPSEIEDVREVLETKDPAPEIVYLPALAYYAALDELNRQARRLMNVADTRMTSEGLSCLDTSVTATFDIPLAITPSSFYLDIKRDNALSVAADGDSAKTREYVTLSGLNGSHLEHATIEALFGSESVSAVKLMQIATEQNVPVRTFTAVDAPEVDSLATSAEIKDDIRDALAQGYEVVVPDRDITYRNWKGIAYIARDPGTGEAGYMISSSLAGGKIVDIIFGAGVAGVLALSFLQPWFLYYRASASDSAHEYLWFFWCALQRKDVIPREDFIGAWLAALHTFGGWGFASPSEPKNRKVDCTDLLLWSFSLAFVGNGWDPVCALLPLFIPATNAHGLANNFTPGAGSTTYSLMKGLFPAFRGYFPYTKIVADDWRRGDIMSVHDENGHVGHSIVYFGEDANGLPTFFESSAADGVIFVDPDNSHYDTCLECMTTSWQRAWTHPYNRGDQ